MTYMLQFEGGIIIIGTSIHAASETHGFSSMSLSLIV